MASGGAGFLTVEVGNPDEQGEKYVRYICVYIAHTPIVAYTHIILFSPLKGLRKQWAHLAPVF